MGIPKKRPKKTDNSVRTELKKRQTVQKGKAKFYNPVRKKTQLFRKDCAHAHGSRARAHTHTHTFPMASPSRSAGKGICSLKPKTYT
jgi:hypothetical protein